jgi:hypothetical protein
MRNIVKKLKLRSQSAGNFIIYNCNNLGTSETLRNEIQGYLLSSIKKENIKKIFDHIPKHYRPNTDEEFGHYLAGLIDGEGHFSNQDQLIIAFDERSVQLAYYIKKKLGFGNVKKVKNKKAYIFIIASFNAICKVLILINNKLRLQNKLNQVDNILKKEKYAHLNINFQLNKTNDLVLNYWLAGFTDADGSFQIKLINTDKKEVKINFQLDQKIPYLLELIKLTFGGNIVYSVTQNTYYYGSTSFAAAKKFINYFDDFHLQSNKQINYLKWRKAYLLIQKNQHLTLNGLAKIKMLKNTMNNI